jgi:hypothetical protein
MAMTDRKCLQCNESEAAIKASQRRRDPIFCGAVDYFGEVEWDLPHHRFREWTDRELVEGWRVLPDHVDKYRRIQNAYEIDPSHRQVEL